MRRFAYTLKIANIEKYNEYWLTKTLKAKLSFEKWMESTLTQEEICKMYKISRVTLQKHSTNLQRSGIIYKRYLNGDYDE